MRDPVNRYLSRLKSLPPSVQVRRVRRRLRTMGTGTCDKFIRHPAMEKWLMTPKIREALDKETPAAMARMNGATL